MRGKARSLLKIGECSHAKYMDALKKTLGKVPFYGLWYRCRSLTGAVGWGLPAPRRGLAGVLSAGHSFYMPKQMSSNYLITNHTLGPLCQLFPTLFQGALCLSYSSPPEWHVLFLFPPGQANFSASVNILTLFLPYSLDRAVRTMVTTQTSWQGLCYELHSVTQLWPSST